MVSEYLSNGITQGMMIEKLPKVQKSLPDFTSKTTQINICSRRNPLKFTNDMVSENLLNCIAKGVMFEKSLLLKMLSSGFHL